MKPEQKAGMIFTGFGIAMGLFSDLIGILYVALIAPPVIYVGMVFLMTKIEKVAPVPRPVPVVGPRGTGKELGARALHTLSPRGRLAHGVSTANECPPTNRKPVLATRAPGRICLLVGAAGTSLQRNRAAFKRLTATHTRRWRMHC